MPTQEQIIAEKIKLRDMTMQDWLHHSLFTNKWWMILLITILAWYCLFRYLSRERLTEVMLYGTFVTLVALILDLFGSNLVLWAYPVRFDPLAQPLLPLDLVLLPIPFMFFYQKVRTWKMFILGHFVLSFVFAFVIEPALVWLHMYQLIRWKYMYSFLIYPVIAIVLRWIVKKIVHIDQTNPL